MEPRRHHSLTRARAVLLLRGERRDGEQRLLAEALEKRNDRARCIDRRPGCGELERASKQLGKFVRAGRIGAEERLRRRDGLETARLQNLSDAPEVHEPDVVTVQLIVAIRANDEM